MTNNIIVTKNSNKYTADLFYKNSSYKCKVGYGGISNKKLEGDRITPFGIFKLLSVFYRQDKVGKIYSLLPKFKISKNMAWSNDPKDLMYNKLVRTPRKFSYENLLRHDNAYDVVIVTNFNIEPTLPNKGSAMFIHCDNDSDYTEGCISLPKNKIISFLPSLDSTSKLIIR